MAGPLPEQHAQILAQKLADGQLALFVGAGLSRQAVAKDGSGRKLPLWKDLAERVAAACHEDLATYGGNILDLFDAIVFGQSRFELEEAVRRVLDDSDFEPSDAHHALAELRWAGVYTTNYDGLLGRVLKESPVVEEDHYDRLQRPEGRRPRLFHVHGTLEKPRTLTRDDYRLWPDKHPRAYRDLEALVLNKTVLFVGYSLSDPHLADGLLPMVRRITADREKRLYAWMWQAPQNQVQLLDRRDKIEVVPIACNEDWAAAFQQLAACLGAGAATVAVPSPGSDPHAYDRQQYVAAMEARYGFANLQGLYVGGAGYARTDVSLEEVFVEPDLELTPTTALVGGGSDPADGMSLRWALSQRAKDGEEGQGARQHTGRREPAMKVLAREAKLLIVGAPGEGKSTLLRRVLLQAVAPWREQPDTEPFPVLVKLADWQSEEGPCEGRLARYMQSRLPTVGEISSQAVAAWLKGPVLWLLDGIDEIRDAGERGRFADEVRATSVQWPHHRWVIATRPAGEPAGGLGSAWTRAVLPNLSDPQIEQVLVRWGTVLKTKEGLEFDARRLAADLKRDPGLRQVRGNALLLTLAILFFKTRKRLPHDRWEFYAAADASLRETWVAHRIREAQRYLPGDWLPEMLDRLALEGMIEGRVLFDRAMLKATAKAVLAARGYTGGEQDKEAERFLAAAEDLIGVLVAQAPDRFGFLHLTFQEFYAARAIAKKSEPERTLLIARWWDHPDWREVWPLYALAVQNEPAKYEHLSAMILANGHDLDHRLFRPQFACLRLAGVGSAPLPPAMAPVIRWAVDHAQGPNWQFSPIAWVLGAWERRHTDDVRAALVARLGDGDELVRLTAAQALAAAVGEAEVRAALLARLGDDDRDVRGAAAQALAGWIVAEKFGLPAGEVVPVYP